MHALKEEEFPEAEHVHGSSPSCALLATTPRAEQQLYSQEAGGSWRAGVSFALAGLKASKPGQMQECKLKACAWELSASTTVLAENTGWEKNQKTGT